VAVAAGASWSAAITDDGSLFTWGDNSYGQLGVAEGSNTPRHVPLPFLVAQVAGGHYHMLILSSRGDVYACGKNSSGELGIAGSENRYFPVEIPNLKNIARVICGSCHSLALGSSMLLSCHPSLLPSPSLLPPPSSLLPLLPPPSSLLPPPSSPPHYH
jgi:alpha-tubulin suppressor-like RCC1 family protein